MSGIYLRGCCKGRVGLLIWAGRRLVWSSLMLLLGSRRWSIDDDPSTTDPYIYIYIYILGEYLCVATTTGIAFFVECLRHSVKALPSVTLGK
jgi:hypothetical protein